MISQTTLKKLKVTFYADDTVLYSSNKDVNVAIRNVQEDLNNLTKWFNSISIHINPPKTKYMIFRNKHATPKSTLQIGNTPIKRVDSYNYLGVTLDEQLTFNKHAQNTINRVSAKVYQLPKIRHLLTKKTALLIYKKMILPILEYGDIFMFSATKENRKKLQTLQNKALECALGRENRYNTNKLHVEAKLLKLKYKRKMHLMQHMFHVSHKSTFRGWRTHARRFMRSSKKNLIKIKKPNTSKFQRSLTYLGPKLWNSLPKDIIAHEDYGPFRHHLEIHITNLVKKDQCPETNNY